MIFKGSKNLEAGSMEPYYFILLHQRFQQFNIPLYQVLLLLVTYTKYNVCGCVGVEDRFFVRTNGGGPFSLEG